MNDQTSRRLLRLKEASVAFMPMRSSRGHVLRKISPSPSLIKSVAQEGPSFRHVLKDTCRRNLAIIGYVSNESCDYRCKDSIIALGETFISFSHSVEMIEPSLRDEFAY